MLEGRLPVQQSTARHDSSAGLDAMVAAPPTCATHAAPPAPPRPRAAPTNAFRNEERLELEA